MNLFRRRPNPAGTPTKEALPRFALTPADEPALQVQPAEGRAEFTLDQATAQNNAAPRPAPIVTPPAAKPVDPLFSVAAQNAGPEFELRATNSEASNGVLPANAEAVRRTNPLRPAPRQNNQNIAPPAVMAPLAEPVPVIIQPTMPTPSIPSMPAATVQPAVQMPIPPVQPAAVQPAPISNPPPRPNPLLPKPAPVATAPVLNGAAAQPSVATPTIPNSDRYMMVPGRRLARPAYTSQPIISIQGVKKTYQMGDIEVKALNNVDLDLYPGEIIAIMGPSGSGKSTLMNVLGCLDVPTDGTYLLDGVDVRKLNDNKLAEIRSQKIGFVFQSFNLLSRTTALANVELPLIYNGVRGRERHRRAMEVLELVGLGNRVDHHPNELSGGQQQRVAIARALINRPAIILADEPTGNLDSKTRAEIMQLFQRLNRDQGLTIAFVTHDPETAEYCQRVIFIRDGVIARDEYREVSVGIYSNGNGAAHGEEVVPVPSLTPTITEIVEEPQYEEDAPRVDDILYEPNPPIMNGNQVGKRVVPAAPPAQPVMDYPIL